MFILICSISTSVKGLTSKGVTNIIQVTSALGLDLGSSNKAHYKWYNTDVNTFTD